MLLPKVDSLYPDRIRTLASISCIFFSFMLSTCRWSPFIHVLQLATNHIILQGRIGLIYLHAACNWYTVEFRNNNLQSQPKTLWLWHRKTCTTHADMLRRRLRMGIHSMNQMQHLERIELFYDLNPTWATTTIHRLDVRTPFPTSSLVHAQTTSYQNSWQGMENVQDRRHWQKQSKSGFSLQLSLASRPIQWSGLTFTL
jgi:hypothetical protein